MKKQGLKIRAALFLVTAALASSPVLTSVAAATKKDVSSAKDKKSALEQEKKKTEEAIKASGLKSNTESYVKELDTEDELICSRRSRSWKIIFPASRKASMRRR